MEMVTYYFGFTCYFLAIYLVGAGYQLSACYLPIPRRLSAVCLFVLSLWFCLYRCSSLPPYIEQDISSLPFRTLTFAPHKSDKPFGLVRLFLLPSNVGLHIWWVSIDTKTVISPRRPTTISEWGRYELEKFQGKMPVYTLLSQKCKNRHDFGSW